MNIYYQRIEQLRSLMRARDWDAVIVSSSDPHSSEYPCERWKQVQWLTGFTGEAGDVVITLEHAGLWTDTRYFIQAVQQLEDSSVVLHKTRVPEQVLIPEWLRSELGDDANIALDGLCMSVQGTKELPGNIISVPDLLSMIWEERPEIVQTPIFEIQAGESRECKIAWLREFVESQNCSSMLLSKLDEIAWLLNIRASDIDYNPLVISYLLVAKDEIRLYVTKDSELDPQTKACFERLKLDGIEIYAYSEIDFLPNEWTQALYIDPSTLNYELYSRLNCPSTEGISPIELRKAVKTESEIEAIKKAHIKDGVAMEKYLYWLEKSVQGGKTVTEWDAACKLGQLRAQADEYLSDSFETISAYGAGAALPHYITPRENAPIITEEGIYLCDSGAQYCSLDGEDWICGTTDITRTVPMGYCSDLEREDYTLVLKGHIALAMAIFPAGTAGCQLDALAREPLWSYMRNFGHGTGHGVGFFLGVHEGPQDIRQNFNTTPLIPGMIISNEPGIYREGMHGIRHENLLLCVDAGSNTFGSWRKFETLTLCHFDTSAIMPGMLSKAEIEWLNAYNARVYDEISAYLNEAEREWLKAKTAAINI